MDYRSALQPLQSKFSHDNWLGKTPNPLIKPAKFPF